MLSRPALRNFKLKCKWILTLTSTIYSTTIYNLNTQSNWFKHNIGTRNEFYLSFTSPTRIRGSAFKIGDNENSNGFSKTHFPLTRSAKRTLWEFGHGEPGEGQVSASFYSKGWWGKGWETGIPHTRTRTIKLLRPLSASGWRMVSLLQAPTTCRNIFLKTQIFISYTNIALWIHQLSTSTVHV